MTATAGAQQRIAPPAAAMVSLAAGLVATWVAAGSMGLIGHPLRHALTWLALAVAILAGWPRRSFREKGDSPHLCEAPSGPFRRAPTAGWSGTVPFFTLATAVAIGLAMTVPTIASVNVLAVAVVLAAVATLHTGIATQTVLLAALAAAVLGVFRLAATSIPTVWLLADTTGRGLGWLAGQITGRPLWIGASFGGVDFLVLMAALYVGWLVSTPPPRMARAVWAAVAILLGHFLYLVVLAFSHDVLAALPDRVLPPASETSRVGVWAWGNAARALVPWSLPALAMLIHATIAVVMFRWANWPAKPTEVKGRPAPVAKKGSVVAAKNGPAPTADPLLSFGPAVLAALIPLATVLSLGPADLSGKTIVGYAPGEGDWLKPEHEVQVTGQHGMLPILVESLGGSFVKSTNLTAEDLAKADALAMLHPEKPLSEDVCDRIWRFVRSGGALLVAAESEVPAADTETTCNELLTPSAIRVRCDTAVSETLNWEDGCEVLSHPATAGIDDQRNPFDLLVGSSISLSWPASPILVGRWGWAELGSDAAGSGSFRFQSGEKLGDLVLAAEQSMGQGRIVVLGDNSPLHNDVMANSYPFAGRLLGCLAGKAAGPQAWWRQLLGGLAMAAMIALLAWRATPLRIAVAAVVLGASVVGYTAASHRAAPLLPDGRSHAPNNVAYIDASHFEAYSSDTWGEFGIGGLARTLMRNGYLPLMLPEVTPERLERAGLLIVIAPARPFSAAEREAVRGFVEAGGTLLCMVGAQEAAGSRELLADFAFTVPPSPVPPGSEIPEPEPLGAFRQTYTGTGKEAWYVQCYAGWEVTCDSPEARPLILWSDAKTNRPFVLKRPFGRGVVAVIGDSYFAVNENLESAANQVTDNVRFWRWLLTRITPQTPWDPPPPKPEAKPGEADAAKPAADAVKPAADSSDEDSAGEEAGP